MKPIYIIGNLKMNFTKSSLTKYLHNLKEESQKSGNIIGVAVPFIYISLAQKILTGTKILLGAQNMFYESFGAFTGEINAQMLKDYNVKFVIIGHSERRNIFLETDSLINKKLINALDNNLTPILCVGESLSDRQNNLTSNIIKSQIITALKNVPKNKVQDIIIAYEPVWAIGTNVSATKNDANDAIKYIKSLIKELYNFKNDVKLTVLYGGSVNYSNAENLFKTASIDGGLIGGASKNIEEFKKIINLKVEKNEK